MGRMRWRRGAMPDVPLDQRERDADLLAGGHFGNYLPGTGTPRLIEFSDLRQDLQEILYRMDEAQVANLKTGLHILVRLEAEDFKRLRTVLKLINVLFGIGKVLKWSVASFMAGLAAVVLMGEQLQKIWGWALNFLKMVKP